MITEELPLISIRCSERETEGYFVIAANSRYYGGRFGPTPLAHMQDGLLDFCVLKEKELAGDAQVLDQLAQEGATG